jgi:hypothetical protein
VAILLVTFGFELLSGIELIGHPNRTYAVGQIGDVLIAALLIGIARAWELVGEWDTGIVSSIALLVGHKSRISGTANDGMTDASDPEGPGEPPMDQLR